MVCRLLVVCKTPGGFSAWIAGWDILVLAQVISNGAQQLEARTKVIFHLSSSEIAEEMF